METCRLAIALSAEDVCIERRPEGATEGTLVPPTYPLLEAKVLSCDGLTDGARELEPPSRFIIVGYFVPWSIGPDPLDGPLPSRFSMVACFDEPTVAGFDGPTLGTLEPSRAIAVGCCDGLTLGILEPSRFSAVGCLEPEDDAVFEGDIVGCLEPFKVARRGSISVAILDLNVGTESSGIEVGILVGILVGALEGALDGALLDEPD